MINFLQMENLPIVEELRLEESLLKNNDENWCIVNIGSPLSIILGSFNKKEDFVNVKKAQKDNVPLIKRFSGGGTIVVDENTIFVSFIFSKKKLPFSFPEQIFQWTESFYKTIFPPFFSLIENDYVLKDKKCGGSAQYLRKERWLHHTSFLWDFEKRNLNYLKHPPKSPKYRNNRSHEDFLFPIKGFFDSKEHFVILIKKTLESFFPIKEVSKEAIELSTKDYKTVQI